MRTPTRAERIEDAVAAFITNMYEVHPETRDHSKIRCPYVADMANAFLSNYTPRDLAFEALETERDYQDRVWRENAGLDATQPVRTVAEEAYMLEAYVQKARDAWLVAPRNTEVAVTTDILRKCGGIVLRALENHGAPKRG